MLIDQQLVMDKTGINVVNFKNSASLLTRDLYWKLLTDDYEQ